MSKITVKDIPIGIKIKVTKKRLLSIPKLMYNKVSKFYNDTKNKINNYVTEDEKKAALKNELNKFDEKRKELSKAKKEVKKSSDFTDSDKKYYLEAIEEEIEKIKNKRKKRKSKGLGVFSIGKLYINKYISNQKEKAIKRKAKKDLEKAIKEQLIIEKEEKELREKLEKLKAEKTDLIEKRDEAIKNNPKLEEYYNLISSEEKTSEKKIMHITAIREATEEEKSEIKKSNKYKKAIAAISAIVVAAGIAIGSVNGGSVNNSVSNIPNNNVEVTQTIQQNNNIYLNDYVKLENGSKIFDTPTFDGRSGEIGINGYDENTLFKVNAISYIDENNKVTAFNLVAQNEETKKHIQDSHEEYIKNNPNAIMNAIHITPCNNIGTPELDNELGGWTNTSESKINKIDLNNINQQILGGMVK